MDGCHRAGCKTTGDQQQGRHGGMRRVVVGGRGEDAGSNGRNGAGVYPRTIQNIHVQGRSAAACWVRCVVPVGRSVHGSMAIHPCMSTDACTPARLLHAMYIWWRLESACLSCLPASIMHVACWDRGGCDVVSKQETGNSNLRSTCTSRPAKHSFIVHARPTLLTLLKGMQGTDYVK